MAAIAGLEKSLDEFLVIVDNKDKQEVRDDKQGLRRLGVGWRWVVATEPRARAASFGHLAWWWHVRRCPSSSARLCRT